MIDILEFQGQFRWLSNFYIEPDGTHVEGEYQAQKCLLPEDAKKFSGMKPGDSKRLGRKVAIRPDWDEIKLEIMEGLVRIKFLEHNDLRDKLLATDGLLQEGNRWGDTFWGVCNGVGRNELGKILMFIREEMRTEFSKR